jgi:hypothetical protein
MRYIKNVGYAFLLWFFMPMLVGIFTFFVSSALYPALCEWFSATFTQYSPVTEQQEYALLSAILDISAGVLTIMLFSHICVRFDNERMEYMISKTEGMYTRSEGMAIYYPRYFLADVVVSIITPLPVAIASAFVPAKIADFIDPIFEYIFSFTRIFTDRLGMVVGILLMSVSMLIARLLSGYRSLAKWQGIWLSEIN